MRSDNANWRGSACGAHRPLAKPLKILKLESGGSHEVLWACWIHELPHATLGVLILHPRLECSCSWQELWLLSNKPCHPAQTVCCATFRCRQLATDADKGSYDLMKPKPHLGVLLTHLSCKSPKASEVHARCCPQLADYAIPRIFHFHNRI